jgi:hypothetical protein
MLCLTQRLGARLADLSQVSAAVRVADGQRVAVTAERHCTNTLVPAPVISQGAPAG